MVSYLIDSSVWIEYLRKTQSRAHHQFSALLENDPASILGCIIVRMELALDPDDLRRRRVLKVYDAFTSAGVEADDFDVAAAIYRRIRRSGHTPRGTNDCLIAAAALRSRAIVVHNDVDFDRVSDAVQELAVLRLPGS